MGQRRTNIVMAVAFLLLAACGAEASMTTGSSPGSTGGTVNTDPDAPIALVVTGAGLAGVPVGSSVPRWVVPGAVAAPDGSAVFAIRDDPEPDALVRIDPRTGDRLGTSAQHGDGWWHAKYPGSRVAAVEPGGARVVLVWTEVAGARIQVAGRDATRVTVWNTVTGAVDSSRDFEGDLDPEALSPDGQRVYAARSFGRGYHVHVLDLGTGEQWPTSGRLKGSPPEDMYGNVIQAALSPDGSRLATLYRDDVKPDHTAFVHLLDLAHGFTECIDLTAPFGTGAPGTDAIRWRNGKIEVGNVEPGATSGVTATIDPAEVLGSEPREHYHAEGIEDPSPPAIPEGVAATPGLQRFVALAR